MEAPELEKYLHEQIPTSRALGISVKSSDHERVELMAPLAVNLNHKKTAFGGSISVIAILSGWSLVFLRLQGFRNEIVIQESTISYLKPVTDDFFAISTYEESVAWKRFARSFHGHGKGRIMVVSKLFCNGELAATHRGTYVAINNTGK